MIDWEMFMIIAPIKTGKILTSQHTIFELLDKYLPEAAEKSVVAITSKIISLCEGRVSPVPGKTKDELVKQESDYYLDTEPGKYKYSFTLTQNTLIPMAGIDESNGNGQHVLWPQNPQKNADEIREYLRKKFNLKDIGVVITDSTCMPMRWGVIGIALSYSGFRAINDYTDKEDLFGRKLQVSMAAVANGLAATAVLAMGEGAEQTPIAVISDVPFVKFQGHSPTKKELELFYMKDKDEDLFAPFLNAVKWLPGKKGKL
jgi:putative folate metabolism gamma-glutamate ligase